MINGPRCVFVWLACTLLPVANSIPSATAGDAWTGWLGPHRNGWVADFSPPESWPEQLSLAWKINVGEGYGTPLVSGDRVYQHARQGEDEVITCFDLASGGEIWKRSWPVPFEIGGGGERHGAGPKVNPVMADGRLFTASINGVMTAWDAESGDQLWQRDERKRFSINHPKWGASCSPVVDGNRLLIHLGNDETGALYAFDVASGETIWSQGDKPISYSSPVVVELHGVRQVIDWNRDDVAGVDVETGKWLWSYALKHVDPDQNSPTPVQHRDTIIIGAENRGIRSLRPTKTDDGWIVEEAWVLEDLAMNMSTAVINDGRLFGLSHYDSGRLFCINADDGSVLWQGRPRLGDHATFLAIPGHIITLTDSGELRVIDAAAEEYQAKATYTVSDSPTWAAPVLGANYLLIKDREHLLRWNW